MTTYLICNIDDCMILSKWSKLVVNIPNRVQRVVLAKMMANQAAYMPPADSYVKERIKNAVNTV